MALSEREKMLSGDLYLASDPELVSMRNKARKLFSAYNLTANEQAEERKIILKELLGNTAANVDIQRPFYCDYGVDLLLGENVFINYNCTILDCAEVKIGNNVMIGPDVKIYTAYHPLNAAERIKGPELASPITIEENCWIGGGVIICAGVTIGANTTVGAGSVVTRNIPANVFAAGNPCRVIRKLL